MKIKTIILIAMISLIILILISNPRLMKKDMPIIGIEKCECSDHYNITCKSWLSSSKHYSCDYNDITELCGTCHITGGGMGAVSQPSQPSK